MSISSIGSSSPYAGLYSGLSASSSNAPLGETSPREEFMKFQAMTPAQKMRAMMLAKLGVTEEQLKAMKPEERKKIEDKLKEMVKQEVQNDPEKKDQKGLVANIFA
ncbi:hypothetical protein [Caulobacter sp.]|uniref:hypothetical protein n=1 Tax=Caulobacter sp. TaxID=78 RepID=UPI001B1CFA37|nr:hypothetical protein [Caulobacter sp.]MBO9543080.1 hypothetical protein [Caulobacter sp.]